MSDALPAGRRVTAEECERRWEPWEPAYVGTRLAKVSAPWCVAGGWALDLFVGSTTREHEDIEIAVPRAAFGEIASGGGGA
ncbi:nucleotidyltransferase domain-containing protein [Streptomyces roseolus]|uniref:nucleotidyltransferase domain-containing protein n=1 Tax=Streptomyces roseolus TaxID=67358 RepID=UPI00365300F8